MRNDNIQMLTDTLEICKRGYYTVNGAKVNLKLSVDDMKQVRVFLPYEVESLAHFKDFQHCHVMGRCGYGCENIDSFSLARKRYRNCRYIRHKIICSSRRRYGTGQLAGTQSAGQGLDGNS